MVKFNSNKHKVLKYRNRTDTVDTTFGLPKTTNTDSTLLSDDLVKQISSRLMQHYFPDMVNDDSLYFHIERMKYDRYNVKTHKVTPDAQMVEQVVESIKANISEGTWRLFVDDERTPNSPESYVDDDCIVVRTAQHAIKVVEKLGNPMYMHLDYYLGYSSDGGLTIMPFINYYTEKFKDVLDDFDVNWSNHSQHKDKHLTDTALYQFYRNLRNRNTEKADERTK